MKKILAGSVLSLVLWGSMFAESLPPCPEGAFTLAVIPDTQRYEGEGKRVKDGKPPATGPVRNESFVDCVDWILAHRESERIFFVSHIGDISDNRNDPQFAFAAKLMSKFDDRLPYGIAPGNHDLISASTDLFCKYFPAAKFEKEPWYAGHFGGYTNQVGKVVCRDNADSCQLVEAGGVKFVILHVECNAPDPVLAWVDEQLTKYSDRVAIISTHQDLGFLKKEYQDAWNADGAKKAQRAQDRIDQGKKAKEPAPHPDRSQLGRLRWKKCHGKEGNTPQQAWEKCYSKHKNVLLIVSGDQGPVNVVRDISTGVHGNRVFAAMHDDQTHSIRLYRFYPNLEKIEVWSVNPKTGELLTSYRGWTDRDDHNFTWNLKAEPTGCPDFTVESPRAKQGAVIQAADFGVSEANEHNAEAANRAFAEARRVKASKVVFTKGVYRCFDGPGLQIEGLEDCVVDGGGSTFVFRRVVPNQDDPSILVEGYGNVEIKDCTRTEVGNFNVDWDWEHDPLGFWCTLIDAVEGKEDDTSYLDFDLDKPHPKYPNPVAVQLLTPMAKDKKGPRMVGKHTGSVYFGTSAGTMGAKMQWLSPTRMRVWPHVRPDYGYVSSYSSNRYSPKSNRVLVRRLKAEEIGNSFAITHHYYGMNGIVMTSNRHFTLRNVDVWATWGLGVETRGAQKWWQLVNVNVRSKPGENYPVTATADAHHVVQSQGYAKMIDCEVTGHRDDHFNYHDRTQIAWKKGARTVEVVNNRGVAYTLFKVGTLLRLRQQNFAAIDWTGRIVKIDGDFITVDNDLPEQKGLFFVLIDAEYATENFLFKNCRFHDSSFSRGLVLGNNLTFDGCTFGPMNGQALRFQSCYTYNVWCEGIGCRNVVVRNCRFENVLDNYTVGGISSQIYTALRIPWKKYSVMGHVKIKHPEFAKAIADYEAKGVPVTPSGDAVGDILVEGCTFVNPRGYLWYIENGSGFWFRDNNVEWTDPDWPRLPYAGRVRVDSATDVHVPAELLDKVNQ